jgi:saccharopine dehydrogenase-like NADP-dependent oxidoreductase
MEKNTILIPGAYGLVGSGILKTILTKTSYPVIACGRSTEKLSILKREFKSKQLETMTLDANDSSALKNACNKARLVINCIGPYFEHGADIASAALEAHSSYIDFANEQSHYNRLKKLHTTAKERNCVLLTGAGFIPGISTLLAMMAQDKVEGLKSLETYYVQQRYREQGKGLGSYMSAVLESNYKTFSYENGQKIPMRLGDQKKIMDMPAPFGKTTFDRVPTLDSLILPKKMSLSSFANYMNLGGDVPPAMWKLVRLLKVHKRKWAYRILKKMMEGMINSSFEKAVKQGIGYQCVVKIVGCGKNQKWTATAHFPESGEVATTYLPVIFADKILKRIIKTSGLLTPIDHYEPENIIKQFSEFGWSLELHEELDEV